ncbi:hypothetical protein [Paenibacillus sp. S150]|uniref:hypothetical protein n=1 Tax=Paenibacillus sp. S150 TaxID=2749826 RepID=UPI001C57DB2D|nr:hypothetical protein [Paenibacillus sp. S150]MBW4082364.1 hypothetical protein [Paenibacillus sp. S150]
MNGTVTIMGAPFSKPALKEMTLHLAEHIGKRRGRLFPLITPIRKSRRRRPSDELPQHIIRSADMIVPDETGIMLAAKRKGDPIPGPVTGYELPLSLLEQGNDRGWSSKMAAIYYCFKFSLSSPAYIDE